MPGCLWLELPAVDWVTVFSVLHKDFLRLRWPFKNGFIVEIDNIKFTILAISKCAMQWHEVRFSLLCKHHHYSSPEIFSSSLTEMCQEILKL